jgi:3-oxoacyl-[acyl-carrier protein] reductase
MDFGLKGKVAIISGSSAGIGMAIARELAAEGVHVVLAARREQPLRDAMLSIQAEGGSASYAVADMTIAEQVRAVLKPSTGDHLSRPFRQ